MIKLEDFKKAYMALKVDYLNKLSDCNYCDKVLSDENHIDYDWAKANHDIVGTEERLAFLRLGFITECVFEMNTKSSYCVAIKESKNPDSARAAIDFTFSTYGNDKGCFCIKVGIYIFRQYDYYERLLGDSHEDILEEINNVFDQQDHGIVDLPKLRTKLLDIADNKNDVYSIGSDWLTIPEDYFLEHNYFELRNYIIENIAASTNAFYNHLRVI